MESLLYNQPKSKQTTHNMDAKTNNLRPVLYHLNFFAHTIELVWICSAKAFCNALSFILNIFALKSFCDNPAIVPKNRIDELPLFVVPFSAKKKKLIERKKEIYSPTTEIKGKTISHEIFFRDTASYICEKALGILPAL